MAAQRHPIAFDPVYALTVVADGQVRSISRAADLPAGKFSIVAFHAASENFPENANVSDEHLAGHGAALGAGVVLLLSEDACPVAETARVATWLAAQSSGQCGPCVFGLEALAAAVATLAHGGALPAARQRLARLGSLVRGRGACAHPDGAVKFILSAVEVFAAEFADHARHGSCEACTRPAELPLPAVAGRAARASLPEVVHS